jgi:thiamine pyrophosphokinase
VSKPQPTETQRALIFVNGVIEQAGWIHAYIKPTDLLIAADGGYRHLKDAGVFPHLLVGDLDSIDPLDVDALELRGVEILKYPREKDQTDLEIAIEEALKRGCRTMRVMGAFGGRPDHQLANLYAMSDPALIGYDIRIENGLEEAFLIRKEGLISGRPGEIVSLIPLGVPVHGVTTHNLKYPLHDETLHPYRSRGVSNMMLAKTARVQVTEGLLLCIHLRECNNLPIDEDKNNLQEKTDFLTGF